MKKRPFQLLGVSTGARDSIARCVASFVAALTESFVIVVALSGCAGGDARVEMAAANVIDRTSAELSIALQEYHEEAIEDDTRWRRQAVLAFTKRIADAADDDQAVQNHTAQFVEALNRLSHDAQTEQRRYQIARQNLGALSEVSTTMRKLAINSLSLEDETKRYLSNVLIRLKEASNKQKATTETPGGFENDK